MTAIKTVRLVLMGFAALVIAPGFAKAQQGFDPSQPVMLINWTTTRSIVAVRSSQPNTYSALSLRRGPEYGKWVTYTAPRGTSLWAVAMDDLLALSQKGPDVKELAVFDPSRNQWMTQALPKPAKGPVTPKIFNDVAVFPVGKCVYVYQGKLQTWSTLTLPTDEAPDVMVWGPAVSVRQGTKLYIYSVANGSWSGAADAPREVEGFPGGFRSVSPKAP